MEGRGAADSLYELLPDYVAGTLWSIVLGLVVALSVTRSDALKAVDDFAALIKPFNVPELAVGFMLIVGGVLLPYTLAIALNPLGGAVLSIVFEKWYRRREMSYLNQEHIAAARREIVALTNTSPPKTSWPIVFRAALDHIDSPAGQYFHRQAQAQLVRDRLVLPLAVLVGCCCYVVLGQTVWALLAALITGVVTLAVLVDDANRASKRLDEKTFLAYLAVQGVRHSRTAPTVSSGDDGPSSSDAGVASRVDGAQNEAGRLPDLAEGKMGKDRYQYYHDKGQSDFARGKYDPPHERVEDLIGNIIAGESDAERRDRDAYEKGRDHAKRQKK